MEPIRLETVIGLETHVQLRTQSKLFCACDNTGEDKKPNTTICPVCMGHPGTLPVPNATAIEWAVKVALALNCKIASRSHFDRKSYFYPDLPKGYQISQDSDPIGSNGHLNIFVGGKEYRVRIERVHLEEDAAKMIHASKGDSLVDYDRAGTPLVEIVTKPDIASPEVAKAFLQEVRLIMRYLGVSDADMEKGHLRCDANISLKPVPEDFQYAKEQLNLDGDITTLFPKTEIKNLNSFRSVERGLAFEQRRQTKLWEAGEPPMVSVTRSWDDEHMTTIERRKKESLNDYRYFPEPDIPPFECSKAFVAEIEKHIPELPAMKRARFADEYGITPKDANVIIEDKHVAHFTEQVISELKAWLVATQGETGTAEDIWTANKKKLVKQVVSWITSRLYTLLNERKMTITDMKISPENFAELLTLLFERRLNSLSAQKILTRMFETGEDPSVLVESMDLAQDGDAGELSVVIDAVLSEHADIVAQYKAGKTVVLQFLIGAVMKKTKGKSDPEAVREAITHKLK
ncbi:MAG: Asp-tRNA(Asn)/Glu-tRNA(Gln) amidotransferase subunit GatB [Patescibacteria group bacterium]